MGPPLTSRLSLASVQRLRDKYEAELAELGQAERQLQGQCAELKGRLAEAEGEAARLQGLVRQKDAALAAAKAVSRRARAAEPQPAPSPPFSHRLTPPVLAQVNEQLAGEGSGLAQVLRQEFADRLAASEEENRRARAELQQLRREKQAELEDVHQRWVGARPWECGGWALPRLPGRAGGRTPRALPSPGGRGASRRQRLRGLHG